MPGSVSDPSAAAASASCTAWRPSKPTPQWVTDRAVALLHEYYAIPGSHQLGDDLYEWGEDGRLYRYFFTMHPPDGENPKTHPGVEAYYCATPPLTRPAPRQPSGSPLVPLALAAAALTALVVARRR